VPLRRSGLPGRLYAIADGQFGDPLRLGQLLFAGGARVVQIRHKAASSGQLLTWARTLVETAPPDGIVIVNDRVDVARLARAGGVHLGQEDLPVAHAREQLGPDVLIGKSTHSLEQAQVALEDDIDYLAIGPVFPTSSKPDAAQPVGLEGVAAVSGLTDLPVVAIGGIRLGVVSDVLRAGASAVAAISDLSGAADPESRTREFIRALGPIPG
jgi:thiamine-phosphate pyrophosphorylase